MIARESLARGALARAGIGLSLARRMAELLGLDLLFTVDEGVFRARLSFQAP